MTTLHSYGIGTILTLIFMILKLTETINWSWWIIFLPLGIELGFSFLLLILVCFGFQKTRKF
jgi:ABC-type antimicrobial peptide transport system permease subunit